jgi:TatD DNase family protein
MLDGNDEADIRPATDQRPEPSLQEALPCLFDAHCHLQDERFGGGVNAVLQRAREKNVTLMMCCGCRENDWRSVLDLSEKKGVLVSFGLHPWYAGERTPRWLERLGEFLTSSPQAGIGEIGLDTKIKNADCGAQEEVFISQLHLARDLKRPVSIHCRGAFGRMIHLLEKDGGITNGGLIHSYSGPRELVHAFEDLGLSLSFSGAITNPQNKRSHLAIEAVSPGRLLIETDSPDMPPLGIQTGALNEPANLPLVLEAVAPFFGWSKKQAAEVTGKNAYRLFVEAPHAAFP